MREIGRDRLQTRALLGLLQHLAPHRHQNAGAIGRQVQPAEQLLARRFHHLLQAGEIRRQRDRSGKRRRLPPTCSGSGENSRTSDSKKARRPRSSKA